MYARSCRSLIAPLFLSLLFSNFSDAQNSGLVSSIAILNRKLETTPRFSRPIRGSVPTPTLTVLQARQKLVEQLIRTNPTEVRSAMLSPALADQLRSESPFYAAAIEAATQWSGTLEATIEDDFTHGRSITHWYVHAGDHRIEMFFPAGQTPSRHIHENIVARGVGTDRVMSVETIRLDTAATPPPAGLNCTPVGLENTAVLVMEQPNGGQPYPDGGTFWTSSATWPWPQDYFGASTPSANSYWNEASFGVTTGTGTIFGPFQFSSNESCNDTDSLQADALAVAKNNGVDFSTYSRISIIYPVLSCGFGGLGTVGCNPADSTISHPYSISWIPVASNYPTSQVLWGVVTHEEGHNLGLHHSSSLDFGNITLGAIDYNDPYPGSATASPGEGVRTEYGDPYTVMGGGSYDCGGQYTAFNKSEYLTWMNRTSDVMEVMNTGGSFKILPFEDSTGLRALRILRDPLSSSWIWLEYRQPLLNYDSDFNSCGLSSPNFYNGAAVYYESPYSQDGHLFLLDMSPSSVPNNFAASALTPGHSWSDPYSLLTLSATAADTTGVSVTANYDQPCASLQISSSTFPATGGTGTINVTAPGTCSWTAGTVASWITINSGASGTGNGIVHFTLASNSGAFQRNGYITVQRQSLATTQAGAATFVSNMNPTIQGGLSGAIQFTFNDPAGVNDIQYINMEVHGSDCQVQLDPSIPAGSWFLFLLDPTTDTFSGGILAGHSGTASNSSCTLNGATSSVTANGNQLQVTLGLTFASSFQGSYRVSASVCDSANTDMYCEHDISLGTWQVASPVIAVTPSSGKQGATVPISIVGTDTHFSSGASVVSVSGTGVTSSATTVSDITHLSATLTIGATAGASARVLTVTTGSEVDTVPFTVNASGQVQLSAPSLSFGNQNPYTTSSSQLVTLTNNGSATLNISGLTASSDFGISSTTCGASLNAGSSCNIYVDFQPMHVGNLTGSLTLVDDAPNSPQSIPLSGYGNAILPISRPVRPSRPIPVLTGTLTRVPLSKLVGLGIHNDDRVTCSSSDGGPICSVEHTPATGKLRLAVDTSGVQPGRYILYLATPDKISSSDISIPIDVKSADSDDRPTRPEK